MNNRKYQFLLLFVGFQVIMLMGCSQNIVFEKNYPLQPQEGWHMNDTLHFSYELSDTTRLYNLFINVRNTTDYPYNNFFVFFQTQFPDGQLYRDTVEMILAQRDGQWTGEGLGKIRSNSFHFRRDVWFPQAGEYKFSIQHAMREELITGISDIGLRIEEKDNDQ